MCSVNIDFQLLTTFVITVAKTLYVTVIIQFIASPQIPTLLPILITNKFRTNTEVTLFNPSNCERQTELRGKLIMGY